MTSGVRTSQTHPLRVGWIVEGRVGLTIAPGKRGPSGFGARWERDLRADLVQLLALRTSTLVCLVEDGELELLGIRDLIDEASLLKLVVERLPIPDGGVPDDVVAVRRLVDAIVDRADRGETIVIHCRGGLGRSGTIGGCVLVAMGTSVADALERLRAARGPDCPETAAQRDFVARFAENVAASPPSRAPAADLARIADLDAAHDKIAGAVLGAAIGDAMGHPTEFVRSMEAIRERFGPRGVEGYALYWERGGRRFAPYTDDTQMAEMVLRALLMAHAAGEDLDGTMVRMAREFVAWSIRPQGGHRAPGNACLSGCGALAGGAHWSSAGGPTAGGCGSVMRAYPFGLVLAGEAARAEAWAVAHSRLTHGDPIALAACAAMAVGTRLALVGAAPPDVLRGMVDAAARQDAGTAEMIERAVAEANAGVGPEVTLERLEGWAAHEAIAAGAYVFARHPDDARAAILEGANTKGDSDSIATLAGALVGARVGASGLPQDWIRDLERASELLGLALAVPSIS